MSNLNSLALVLCLFICFQKSLVEDKQQQFFDFFFLILYFAVLKTETGTHAHLGTKRHHCFDYFQLINYGGKAKSKSSSVAEDSLLSQSGELGIRCSSPKPGRAVRPDSVSVL